MFNKKLVFALAFFVIIVSISAVSADDLTNDTQIISQIDDVAVSEDDVFNGEDTYDDEDSSDSQIDPQMTCRQIGNRYGDVKLEVVYTDKNTGEGISDEPFHMYISHEFVDIYQTDSDGKILINFNKKPGNYDVKFKHNDDDDDCARLMVVITQGYASSFSLKQVGAYYKDSKLVFTLTNLETNKPFVNEKINLKFSNGKSATIKTNSKGQVTYNVPFNPGKYKVTAKLESKYIQYRPISMKFVIGKTYLNFAPSKLSTTYGSGKTFTVKVTNKFTKHAISGVKVNLKVFTGKKYKNVKLTTDSKGIAKYNPSSLSMGSHKVVISAADKYTSGKMKSSSIKISKAVLSVSAPKLSADVGSSDLFKVTVKNKESKKVMANVKVTLKISGAKSVTLKTDKNGIVKYDVKSLCAGTHNVNILTKGDSKVKAASAKSSIVINKIKTNLNQSAVNDNVLYVKLVDAYGNILNATVNVNNSLGENFTVFSNQFARFNTNASYISLNFAGDNKYNGCEYIIEV